MDFWPFLWKLPERLFPACSLAREVARKHRDLILRNYAGAQETTGKRTIIPSVNYAIREKLKHGWEGVSKTEGAEIGHHLLTGTTDTTASSLIN